VTIAASVGIVEKIICFLFLVPSAMLSSVSAIAAQNAGAGKHGQGTRALRYGIMICVIFGCAVSLICQFAADPFVALFAGGDSEVIRFGGQYLRAYVLDCIAAGIHFCFSGYFCAYGKAFYSFIHNIVSILLIRIPGAYLASVYFPETLYPMGLAAPLGSLLSSVICLVLFLAMMKKTALFSESDYDA
jgi:Na+-driven multidrug efflux pump